MTRRDRLNADLRRIALLSDLSEDALECVARVARRRTYAEGETIFLAGDRVEAVYLLVEGHVTVYRLSLEGRRQVLVQLHPGQAFNTVPPFLPEPVSPSSAEALTDVVLYAIPTADYLRLVETCPRLARVILRDFAQRLSHLTGLVEDLALYSVRERLARFLLEHAEAGEITRTWTYDDLAERLGTVRDVVGRCIRAFEDKALIRRERGRLVLLDREQLEAVAEGKA
jgi:CRP/FNR family transcriptional regulator